MRYWEHLIFFLRSSVHFRYMLACMSSMVVNFIELLCEQNDFHMGNIGRALAKGKSGQHEVSDEGLLRAQGSFVLRFPQSGSDICQSPKPAISLTSRHRVSIRADTGQLSKPILVLKATSWDILSSALWIARQDRLSGTLDP